MRRLVSMATMGVIAVVGTSHADKLTFTMSTGYNETSLSSPFNRSTEFQTQITRGNGLYLGSIDNHGLTSIGVGRISSGSDFDRSTSRYPSLTLFARPGAGPGVELTLHEEWYWTGHPTRTPGKYITVFQTEAGLVCQDGELPKVRATHRFVTSQRRFPGRNQGIEWVWEFRQDFPAAMNQVADRGLMLEMERRTVRFEHWAFFSREIGFGVLRVNLGATQKTVVRPATSASAGGGSIGRLVSPPGAQLSRVPVVMARLTFEVRRW